MDVKVQDKISRSREEVFNAIKKGDEISRYFVSYASSDLEEGATIKWEWSDYKAEGEIKVIKLVPSEKIIFQWPIIDRETTVTIILKEIDSNSCTIEITESFFEINEEQMKLAMGQTGGWMHFICSLKAYLYTGINLRR